MEIKIDLSNILPELKPETIKQFVDGLVTKAISDFSNWDVMKAIRDKSGPILTAILAEPEVQKRIEAGVRQGVESVIGALPQQVKDELVRHIQKSLTTARFS